MKKIPCSFCNGARLDKKLLNLSFEDGFFLKDFLLFDFNRLCSEIFALKIFKDELSLKNLRKFIQKSIDLGLDI